MRPIVVSKAGAVAMEASSRFEYEIAPELGLRNVLKLEREYWTSKIKYEEKEIEFCGEKIKCMSCDEVETDLERPSREEIDNYIRKRDEYVAEQVLKNCGWDAFVERCQWDKIEDFIEGHFPCQGPDGQCNMFCPQYNTNCWGIEGNNVSFQQKPVN